MAQLVNSWLHPANTQGLRYEYVEDLNQQHCGILVHPNPDNNYWYYQWLQYFFQDEPKWELRLKEWINSMQNFEEI